GQVAFEQPFAVLHDPTRGARAAGGEIKIGKPTLAVPDRDVGAENSPNTVEEGASRDIARQGTVLQRAFEIDAGFSQTLADERAGRNVRSECEIDEIGRAHV